MKFYIPKDRTLQIHKLFRKLLAAIETYISSSSSTNMMLNQNKLTDRNWGPSSLLYTGYRVPGVLSTGLKRLGSEADHSPPSSTEVRNGGAISPLTHTSSGRGA
jgi:hypothetical protein